MTLQHFLDATAHVPDTRLRQAMVAALAVEPARTPEARVRFYDRVARELNLDAVDAASPRRSGNATDVLPAVFA